MAVHDDCLMMKEWLEEPLIKNWNQSMIQMD